MLEHRRDLRFFGPGQRHARGMRGLFRIEGVEDEVLNVGASRASRHTEHRDLSLGLESDGLVRTVDMLVDELSQKHSAILRAKPCLSTTTNDSVQIPLRSRFVRIRADFPARSRR